MKTNEPMPIICGTDFSENAGKAATAAATLAVLSGTPLVLVHVADEFNTLSSERADRDALLKPVREQIRSEAARLRAVGAIVDEQLLTGSVAERAIREFTERNPAGLLVVSSVSKTAFDRWTLGTVSESLAESVSVPTLVVRSSEPFEAWARGERPLKVFIAADFSPVSEAAFDWVAGLRRLGPCEVTVVHLDRPSEARERLGVGGPITFLENPPEVQRLLERDLQAKVQTRFGEEDFHILVEPVVDRPDASLIELAVEARADLIVVGAHQRAFLRRLGHPSISRGILRHAPMSVACVPSPLRSRQGGPIPKLQRVLVATDFSELGNRAVPYAYSLLHEGGSVFLIHVTHPMSAKESPTLDAGSESTNASTEHTAHLRKLSARLRELIPVEAARRGVSSEVTVIEHLETKLGRQVGMLAGIAGEAHVIEEADPATGICQAAERFGVDVICLGSHGRTGLRAVFLGSVAQAVMAQSHRPVLIIRPPRE